jgi:leader peptidase (prepilin peptidase) / N-methyltransferase
MIAEDTLLIVWFFIVGAAIGSFLNVVVYRLPKAISLIAPPSHCPACKHRIRWFDNIPVISWLVLRGRCRDCGGAISFRYPLVEAINACMFAMLMAAECAFEGVNLPARAIYEAGDINSFSRNNAELYGIVLYHLLLLCTLLAAALIEIDHNRPPLRLFAPALAVGIIAPLIWPYLRPAPAWPGLGDWTSRALDCVAGLASGGLLGYLAWQIQRQFKDDVLIFDDVAVHDTSKIGTVPGAMTWGLLCVGVFLGWQAVCGVAFVISLLALLAAAVGKRRKRAGAWPFSVWLYTVTLAWILAWSTIVDFIKQIVD